MKTVYDILPVWAQSTAVSLFSIRNTRLKYGQVFHDTMDQLANNERLPFPQLQESQQDALRRMLEYAREHVAYYRQLDCPADDLSAWPIIDKRTVKTHIGQFISDEFNPSDLLTLHTSGTTGSPFEVKVDRSYHQKEMAFRWRHKAWGGVPYLSRSAYLSGHPVVPADQKRPPFWRIDTVEKRLLCSSYHLSQKNLPYYIEAISHYRPQFIHGYPSSLYLLAQFMIQNSMTLPPLQAVFTASETLLDFQRTTIEKAFSSKVFNWYGNTEMTCNIIQCSAGNLHYRTDYGVLELLDDGTMVCTGLNNLAMPFIRYKVGDRATWGVPDLCACGCQFPLIQTIEGRIEDYILTPDERLIGRLDHLFKDKTAVREAQIVQDSIQELRLRIVRNNSYCQTDEVAILTEARRRLGSSIAIRFEYVDAIERTSNGKFRFVVSRINPTF